MGLENIHTDYFSCPEVSHFVLLSCTNKSVHQTTKSLCLWITLSSHLICLCWLPALAPPHLGIHWPPLSLTLCLFLPPSPSLCLYSEPLVSCSILLSIFTLILSMSFLCYLEKTYQHHVNTSFILWSCLSFFLLSLIYVLTSSFSTFIFPVFLLLFCKRIMCTGNMPTVFIFWL